MKLVLNIVLWKYIGDESCDYFTLLLNKNPFTNITLIMVIIKSTKHNKTKSSTHKNHGNDDACTEKP